MGGAGAADAGGLNLRPACARQPLDGGTDRVSFCHYPLPRFVRRPELPRCRSTSLGLWLGNKGGQIAVFTRLNPSKQSFV